MKYGKLVRDKDPERIKKDGKLPVFHVAKNDREYVRRLKDKLVEEAREFRATGDPGELVDVLEVIHAICAVRRFRIGLLEYARQKKIDKRGGFGGRIVLDEVLEEPACGKTKEVKDGKKEKN